MATRIVKATTVEMAEAINGDLHGSTIKSSDELYKLATKALENKDFKFAPAELCEALQHLKDEGIISIGNFYIERDSRCEFGVIFHVRV